VHTLYWHWQDFQKFKPRHNIAREKMLEK